MAAATRAATASAARQVTKRNFAEAVQDLAAHVEACDYVAIAAQRTGAPTGWRRALPVDTPETAYLKAKLAAESFQPLHFAICPFRVDATSPSTLVAYPYNFHLFPRDELQLGMPAYSFSCQSSYLSSMAHSGFDFNMCIYDGSLVNTLRQLILGSESYGSRPSFSIDVCSDRQVQLVLEAANHISDDLVPLVVPDKAGTARAIGSMCLYKIKGRCHVFRIRSYGNHFQMDIKKMEDEHNLKFRGFREVIDLLSSSQKPIISYNCLNDFTMIHSKFVAPLPPNLHEFMCSLRMVFSNVIDISHMWREIGPLRKAKNIQAALSYLQRQYFVPMDVEIPQQDGNNSVTKSGENVLRITKLFAKLSNLLKISPNGQTHSGDKCHTVEEYSYILYPSCTAEESEDDKSSNESNTTRSVRTDNVVFLWGFRETSVKELRSRLASLHHAFSKDFELRLLDNSCSALIFHSSDTAIDLLREINSESPSLNNFFSEGLKAAGFDAYRKVCRSGLWDSDLAEALDGVSSEPSTSTLSGRGTSEICWNTSLMLDLKEYLEC
uniref:Uncharacterized protein n=1 Tax=Oryza glaberrima TaxID=4538 RepID=I1QJ03_ORYGL